MKLIPDLRGPLLGLGLLLAGCATAPVVSDTIAQLNDGLTDPMRPTSPLEHRSYIHNMEVLGHFLPDEHRGHKMQLMAVGDRRYLVQAGDIIDISDALNPVVVSRNNWRGGQVQVAYNEQVGKWIAIVSTGGLPDRGEFPPAPGPRGVDIYDISDPAHVTRLSRWATDRGDPNREIQTGLGTHRNYYDGGRYAYLTAVMDNNFITEPNDMWGGAMGGLQIVDVSDPAHPQFVSNWHLPGQRVDEVEERSHWASAGDRTRMTTLHGPAYVPQRVEDGGHLAYGPWGSLGMMIHDVSDPANPRLVSQWEPDVYIPGGLPFHTIDVGRLDRGFVITNPEAILPQCREPWHPSYIIDVTDPAHPTQIGVMPIPQPPEEAPYNSFCERYGRFGPHNPPHLKAPGHIDPNFTCYSYFNAGVQCFDITNPREPRAGVAYFIPEQGGEGGGWEALPGPMGRSIRTVDNIFVEWDRHLIWAATDSGLYLLSAQQLGAPVTARTPVREWTLPSINRGFQNFRSPAR